MEILGSLFKLADSTIQLIIQKDKTRGERLAEEHRKLKTEWYDEFNKPENERSNLELDRTMRKLRIFYDTVGSIASGVPSP